MPNQQQITQLTENIKTIAERENKTELEIVNELLSGAAKSGHEEAIEVLLDIRRPMIQPILDEIHNRPVETPKRLFALEYINGQYNAVYLKVDAEIWGGFDELYDRVEIDEATFTTLETENEHLRDRTLRYPGGHYFHQYRIEPHYPNSTLAEGPKEGAK